jgi:DNA-binding XRE family transcriptional regulator
MGRPEIELDEHAGPVQAFAARLRELRAQAGLTLEDVAKTAHFAKGTMSAAQAGRRLATWSVASAYIRACGGDPERYRPEWEVALTHEGRDRESSENSGRPARRRIGLKLWAAAAALVVLAAVGTFVAIGTNRESPEGAVKSSQVQMRTPPDQYELAEPGACAQSADTRYRFPGAYVGQVFVLIRTLASEPKNVDVDLIWGNYHWTSNVTVHPAGADPGIGGTLILFSKDQAQETAPRVRLRTSEPTCVEFGTADTKPRPAPVTWREATDWDPL